MNTEYKHEITGVLENWFVHETLPIIWGNIYNDAKDRFEDGQLIHTSSIPDFKTIDFKQGAKIKTRNSVYVLGRPLDLGLV